MIKLNNIPRRVWINAPSIYQCYHKYHGINGLAIEENDKVARFFFLNGDFISMLVPIMYLSENWVDNL
jgi:hypothetical protein